MYIPKLVCNVEMTSDALNYAQGLFQGGRMQLESLERMGITLTILGVLTWILFVVVLLQRRMVLVISQMNDNWKMANMKCIRVSIKQISGKDGSFHMHPKGFPTGADVTSMPAMDQCSSGGEGFES